MKSLIQLVKFIKIKNLLYVIIFISIVLILLLAYLFIEQRISNELLILILFPISISQILILQYYFKNELKNNVKIEGLNDRVYELNEKLEANYIETEHKSIYFENISFEIRTPLSTILGMLNILKQSNLDADQHAQVEIAEYSSKHLLQLVDLATKNADIEKGDIKLDLLAIDLKTNLSQLFKVFEYQAWEKGLQFDFKFLIEEKQKFSLLGDIIRIRQVLINLINNAIKFTNTGKISIIIDQTISIEDYQIVSFYIKDTGIGLRPDEIKQIFDDSKAFNSSNLNNYLDDKVGLSISYKLVKLMGGELKIESMKHEGTTFYFSLQLKKTLSIKTETEILKPVFFDKFSVLVAEDNRMNQKAIKFLLEQQGADCTFVKNGIEALELYKILDFDMIFMDIYMPDMDGFQATTAIKNTDKYAVSRTPIVAVSASSFKEDIAKTKLVGIEDFLAKPIEVDKLKTLLIKHSKKNIKLG